MLGARLTVVLNVYLDHACYFPRRHVIFWPHVICMSKALLSAIYWNDQIAWMHHKDLKDVIRFLVNKGPQDWRVVGQGAAGPEAWWLDPRQSHHGYWSGAEVLVPDIWQPFLVSVNLGELLVHRHVAARSYLGSKATRSAVCISEQLIDLSFIHN